MEPEDRLSETEKEPETNEPEEFRPAGSEAGAGVGVDAKAEAKAEAVAEAIAEAVEQKKAPPWKLIALASVVAVVLIFAVVWELGHGGGLFSEDDSHHNNAPPKNRSEVQDELNALDWVDQEFLPINEFSRPGDLLGVINGVVIHYVGNPNTTAMQNRNYFANLAITAQTYASSNFIIGLDGEVIQCVPVDEIAYASNIRNADTLSIELCHPDDSGQFTPETYASAVLLTAWLCRQYGLTADDVLRHYDVTEKLCPLFFVKNEDEWEAFKDAVTMAITEK